MVSVATAIAVAGCSSGSDTAPDPSLRLSVAGRVTVDDSSGVVVTGAKSGDPVTIEATVTDADHVTWTASATYPADSHGRVDTATQAPRSGSYRGVEPTGLVATMTSSKEPGASFSVDHGQLAVTYRASQDGRSPADARQVRSIVQGITAKDTDLGRDGIVGTYVTPTHLARGATAVLVFGGSEGGDGAAQLQADALAEHGHPALAIAYFGAPGLPQALEKIPLEYFGRALSWLAHQPGVDPSKVAILGGSRGAEAALLVALHYPQQVAGVVALSPTDTVHPGLPNGDAWTWRGRPLATGSIATDHIAVPILLVCGDDDQLWASCPSSRNIDRRGGGPRTVLTETGAGHGLDFPVPDLPVASGSVDTGQGTIRLGGTVAADAQGRLDAWPQILTFLDQRE